MEQNKFTQKMNKNLEETFDETQCNKLNTMSKTKVYNKKYPSNKNNIKINTNKYDDTSKGKKNIQNDLKISSQKNSKGVSMVISKNKINEGSISNKKVKQNPNIKNDNIKSILPQNFINQNAMPNNQICNININIMQPINFQQNNFSNHNNNMINTPELKQQNMINKYTPNPDNNINIIKNNNNNIQNQNQNKNHIIQSVQQLQNNNFIKNQHINNIISIEPVDNNQNQIKAKTNLRMPKLEPYSFPSSTEAAKTGLKNLGNTSYLNSVLQLLGSLHSYSSYFLNPKQGKFFQTNISKFPLCFVVHRLCTHLFPYKKENKEKLGREIYAPESFLSVLGKFNSVYNDNETEKDPKLLIIYILDKLHQELNKEKNNNEENDSNTEINIKIACDRDATINTGIQNFFKNNTSIIFNYFNWLEIKETKCMNCNNDIYNLSNFSTFELNIYDCVKYRKLKSVKIEDCLDFYKIPKIKKRFCYFCKNYYESTTTTEIYSSPNIFIFLLNMENNDNDDEYNNINFILEKNINITNFVENKDAPSAYEIGGIVFLDKNKNKYITLCLSPMDQFWYLYEDEIVKKYDYDYFIENEYNNKNIYKPCILLYKTLKIKN